MNDKTVSCQSLDVLTLAGQDRRLLMTLLLDYYHPECLKPGANKCS